MRYFIFIFCSLFLSGSIVSAGYLLTYADQEKVDSFVTAFQERISDGKLDAKTVDNALIRLEQSTRKQSSKALISAIRHELLGTARKYLDNLSGGWNEYINFKKYYHLGYRIRESNEDMTNIEMPCGIWMKATCTTFIFKNNNIVFSNTTKTDGSLKIEEVGFVGDLGRHTSVNEKIANIRSFVKSGIFLTFGGIEHGYGEVKVFYLNLIEDKKLYATYILNYGRIPKQTQRANDCTLDNLIIDHCNSTFDHYTRYYHIPHDSFEKLSKEEKKKIGLLKNGFDFNLF